MNLPLEYSELSQYFDALGCSSPDKVNRRIGALLKKYKIKTVLDLTCGTGAQVLWLAKQGFQVVGSDLSPKLLKIAQQKARAEHLKIKFLQSDMRTVQAGQFDAAITIFNAVGHLTRRGFEKAIKNISTHLKTDGLYIFDIFNFNALSKKDLVCMNVETKKNLGNLTLHHTQYSKLDKQKQHLISYDKFCLQYKTGKSKIIKGKFSLQIYTAKELKEMLAQHGFKVIELLTI
ncbi:class I SAM-dependent methyltransferase, partial [Candidatus Dependentiae bacterium]|nr:class I SAM-dependent methyltransferase [Candidatus Dependentiae bacterium]